MPETTDREDAIPPCAGSDTPDNRSRPRRPDFGDVLVLECASLARPTLSGLATESLGFVGQDFGELSRAAVLELGANVPRYAFAQRWWGEAPE